MSYRNEDDWRRVGIDALNRIFAARRGTTIPPLHASLIGSAWSSRIIGTHGGGAGVVVFRNSCISPLDSIPQVELLGHVAHLNSNMHQHRALFERWRIPCLGVTVVGMTSGRYIISAGTYITRHYRQVLCYCYPWPPLSSCHAHPRHLVRSVWI